MRKKRLGKSIAQSKADGLFCMTAHKYLLDGKTSARCVRCGAVKPDKKKKDVGTSPGAD